MLSTRRILMGLGVLGLALGLSAGAYAYTTSNTVPGSSAGDGSGTISGYTVSAIHYVLSATNPQNVTSVTFNVNTAPATGSTMEVQINSNWYTCTNVTTTLTCNTSSPQLTVANANSLEALIAQ
jgi:hypothetical protein